jgi:hypothetical protein
MSASKRFDRCAQGRFGRFSGFSDVAETKIQGEKSQASCRCFGVVARDVLNGMAGSSIQTNLVPG